MDANQRTEPALQGVLNLIYSMLPTDLACIAKTESFLSTELKLATHVGLNRIIFQQKL